MTRDERDRDYWYILLCALFWVGALWFFSLAWMEWIR